MLLKNYNTYFFFILLLLISWLTFLVLKPFWLAIFLAAVLAVIFHGPYRFFLAKTGERQGVSAFLTALLAILVFLIPFFVIAGLVGNELLGIYNQIGTQGNFYEQYISPIYNYAAQNKILSTLGLTELINREALMTALTQVGQGALSIFQKTYQGIAHFLFVSFVVFFSLFYFLIKGKQITEKLMFLSPLKNKHEKLLVAKFISISRATVKGTLVVAFVQGFIGGMMFALAGIPSATIWAVVMMVLSLIPMIGSSIIWFPAGIVLILSGKTFEGILILLVGLMIISLIDNFLRPQLVGKDVQMHPLLVFFATLGGISMFGFLGFVIGPIIVALFLALWEIYAAEFSAQLKKFNT